MADKEQGTNDEGIDRRRFVQACVVIAAGAAMGSTAFSLMGLRSPLEVDPPPSATESVAICPVCSVGCGMISVSSGGEPFPPRGDAQSSSTSGMACTRGVLPPASVWPTGIATPLRRVSGKGTPPTLEQFEPVEWDEALDSVASVLVDVGMDDPSARGCILGGGLALEDAYVAGKLFKGVLGSSSIDTVESLHSRTTDRVLMDQLGEVASPTCLNDIGLADLIVVVGEDLATTHPVAYAHVVEAVTSKGATLVVIDPRVTATASRTECIHLPVRAGGEVSLVNSIAHVLVHELGVAPDQWALDNSLNAASYAEYSRLYGPVFDENERVDAQQLIDLCDGPSDWVAELGNRDAAGFLKSFDVPTITGIDGETIRDLARRWNLARNVLTIWSSRIAGAGDGGAAVSSILNLHLLSGQAGRPGSGPFGMQAYAGGRGTVEAGASPISLPGAQPAGEEPSEALVETWGTDLAANAARLPPGPGVMDMLERARFGEVRALLLMGGSVSAQLPDAGDLVREALEMAYVVSTAGSLEDPDVVYADLVLPRISWFEREAYFVSSERKVARSLPSMAAMSGTRTEMEVLAGLGSRLVAGPEFDLSSPSIAVDELRMASTGAPADISALSLGPDLTEARGMQWPVPDAFSAASRGSPRRHMGQDGRGPGFPTATGRALTLPQEHPGLRRPPDPEFPFTAISSVADTTWWDGLQYIPRGGDVVRPVDLEPAYIEIGPEDAADLGLVEGSTAVVTSGDVSMDLPVRIAPPGMAPGHVFIPWGVDGDVRGLAPTVPLDVDGVPPWSTFQVKVELSPFS
ncbi:MAG: molybdopterin-dependent oxidoreductase [Thermoplasmata archaeon]|nr:MAG: molybdopterin-dependent oxidoreductase [Thermoplasmata archaeon]